MEERPPSRPRMHSLYESDQEALQGETHPSRRDRGEPQEDRPLRLLVGFGEEIHPLRFQGRCGGLRHGRAHQSGDRRADEGREGLERGRRDMRGIVAEARGLHRAPVLRGGLGQERSPCIHEGVFHLQAQFRSHHGFAALPEARGQMAGPEPPEKEHDLGGAGFRLRIGFRERRPPVLRQGREGEGDGDDPQFDNHPQGMLRGLLVLRHSRPSGYDGGLPFRGFHTRGGERLGLIQGFQRRDPGCRRPDGQHVWHRMLQEDRPRPLREPQMPRRETLPQTPYRSFPSGRPAPIHLRYRRGPACLREFRDTPRHDPRRQEERSRLSGIARLRACVGADEDSPGACLRRGPRPHGEAGIGCPEGIQEDVRFLLQQDGEERVPDVLLHRRPSRLHRRRHEGAGPLLRKGALDTSRAGPGLHPYTIDILDRHVVVRLRHRRRARIRGAVHAAPSASEGHSRGEEECKTTCPIS